MPVSELVKTDARQTLTYRTIAREKKTFELPQNFLGFSFDVAFCCIRSARAGGMGIAKIPLSIFFATVRCSSQDANARQAKDK